jgi:hypothetical protein
MAGGIDNWCKSCVYDLVVDKRSLMKYCKENNRKFSQSLWDKCYSEVNPDGDDKEKEIESIDSYLNSMETWVDESENGTSSNENSTRVYSEFWDGDYTKAELDRLDRKYREYEADFDIPDVHTRDMFKKIVKFSYMQDEATRLAQEDPTKENIDTLDKVTKLLNALSDSMKLNLSKRTANDRGGFTDLGNLIARIESTGALCRPQKFEEDDVDRTIREYISGATVSLMNENIDMDVDDIEQKDGIDGA